MCLSPLRTEFLGTFRNPETVNFYHAACVHLRIIQLRQFQSLEQAHLTQFLKIRHLRQFISDSLMTNFSKFDLLHGALNHTLLEANYSMI